MRKTWVSILFVLATVTFVYAVREADATPDSVRPLSPAACQTMDEIFRPMGVRGKEQLLQHLITSSDKLALQTSGDLHEMAEVHASYVRLLLAEANSGNNIAESTHVEGLRAYDAIRRNAWQRCSLPYLKPQTKT